MLVYSSDTFHSPSLALPPMSRALARRYPLLGALLLVSLSLSPLLDPIVFALHPSPLLSHPLRRRIQPITESDSRRLVLLRSSIVVVCFVCCIFYATLAGLLSSP
ncbi:hypothetical protein K466DRAFT_526873 [Polyporus arcularius HHB13444]|uniref:Uncharacterized protein n=1 Tax=Polyporus arcularius HHB13444 TaxID=1314778 RepID=A0A5C3P735_9APHY|nr:hypothetical protein K466DRAFT_526873 [Polyporus arcularius HHB13444]